ncbi:2310_t:CDS:1 [Ambispora gerdemannii]|uniref:2310_t:CDS:1 n=1 Tax=Ambispora gerdemannii TaxID=144530 RepID=A0A9N8WH17_9GLOM|nr:2310_t:CDS:1 [Ambispora gerdemannii]
MDNTENKVVFILDKNMGKLRKNINNRNVNSQRPIDIDNTSIISKSCSTNNSNNYNNTTNKDSQATISTNLTKNAGVFFSENMKSFIKRDNKSMRFESFIADNSSITGTSSSPNYKY